VVEICAHHLHTPPTPPRERAGRELPKDLCDVILRCLEKTPGARYESARAVRLALEACADAGGWTEEQAERWWREQGSRVESRRASRGDAMLTGTQTLVPERAKLAS
jgi:serine/threonine-protein kinase